MNEARKVVPAPDAIVKNGKIQFGVFDAPPRNMNLLDADFLGLGGLTPRFLRRMRLKQWQFFSINHPDCSIGLLVIDLAYLSSSFVYVYDRKNNEYYEHARIKLDRKISIASNLYDGRCHFDDKNYNVEILNRLDEGYHDVKVSAGKSKTAPAIEADFRLFQPKDELQPLVVSLPLGGSRGMYSHKAVCRASGGLRFGDVEITLDPSRDTALIDEHKAFYPHHTYWKWAMLGFIDNKGRVVGANLTDNLIRDQKQWNENAIYCDDSISLLGPIHFKYDARDMMKPWSIYDDEERVELEFIPDGIKKDKTGALVFKMEYYQPYGVFRGRLIDADGYVHEVRDVYGITEYHDALY